MRQCGTVLGVDTVRLYLKTLVMGSMLFAAGSGLAGLTGLRIDGGTLEVFLGLFGAFYAILVGFVIFIAMDNYNQVKDRIGAEVNALQDLRDFLIFVDDDPGKNDNHEVCELIRADLRGYVSEVVEREWKAMRRGKRLSANYRDTPPELLKLMESINQIHVGNRSDDVALEMLVDRIAAITTHRTERLTACGARLSPALRQLVLYITVLASLVFWFLDIPAGPGLTEPDTVTWVL